MIETKLNLKLEDEENAELNRCIYAEGRKKLYITSELMRAYIDARHSGLDIRDIRAMMKGVGEEADEHKE